MSKDRATTPAADLIEQLRTERKMTQREIADALGRDPRMVRKIIAGETSGDSYVQSLSQLAERGMSTPPPRRRGKDGHMVPVRSKDPGQTRIPDEAPRAGQYGPGGYAPPRRGRHSSRVDYGREGRRSLDLNAPKTEGVGRESARIDLMDFIRRAAQGRGRVWGRVGLANGTHIPVGGKGGYRASDVLAGSKAEGNDPFAWFADQGLDRYDDVGGNTTIVHVDLIVMER